MVLGPGNGYASREVISVFLTVAILAFLSRMFSNIALERLKPGYTWEIMQFEGNRYVSSKKEKVVTLLLF